MSDCAYNTLATLHDASQRHTDARKSCAQADVPSRNTQVRTPWVESGERGGARRACAPHAFMQLIVDRDAAPS
jgi:hypothetical protein